MPRMVTPRGARTRRGRAMTSAAEPALSGMFAEWLAPAGTAWLATHFQKQPFAAPAAAAGATHLFGWETLGRVLASERPIDMMTVRAGRLIHVPPPRTIEDVRRLVREGISVVMRASERHDAGLQALAESFRAALPGEVHIQLYVTPGGTNSYGWHYDFEDVFIAQTAGIKDYYFRSNTVAQDKVLGDALDFTAIRHETTPIYAARLVAGDWLYIPATWWHLVKCAQDSLSISVGVMPPEAFARARRVPPGWTGSATTR
jgi:50S ribosomal protein L16 3-hydroxylase